MKIWETIKNGLKRAVKFVVDVLLFIPRFFINGISGFFKDESEKDSIEESFDDEEPVVDQCSSSYDDEPVFMYFMKKKDIVQDDLSSNSKPENKPVESTKQEEAKKPEKPVEPTKQEAAAVEPTKQEETKKPADYPKFASSDKEAANFEAGMVLHYNIAGEKYSKSMWADGAKELHRFASCFLHANAAKEGLDLSKPFADDDACCNYILDELSKGKSKVVNIEDDTKEFLKTCLGNHLYTLDPVVRPRMLTVSALIDSYQKYFYHDEYVALREEWMHEQSRREEAARQAEAMRQTVAQAHQNNSGFVPGVA